MLKTLLWLPLCLRGKLHNLGFHLWSHFLHLFPLLHLQPFWHAGLDPTSQHLHLLFYSLVNIIPKYTHGLLLHLFKVATPCSQMMLYIISSKLHFKIILDDLSVHSQILLNNNLKNYLKKYIYIMTLILLKKKRTKYVLIYILLLLNRENTRRIDTQILAVLSLCSIK